MKTSWNGLALPADNLVLEDTYIGKSCWVALAPLPGMSTAVHLPATTAAVHLWTPDAQIWYALDATPGPIPDPTLTPVVDDEAFVLGEVLLTNERQSLTLPDDGLLHTLELVSRASGPRVLLTALTEIG